MKYQVVLIQMSEDCREYLDSKVVYEGFNREKAREIEYSFQGQEENVHEGFRYSFAEFREVDHVHYTEKEIIEDEPHTLLLNMIADCINQPSDHRIIIELGEKRGDKYYMVDFQDKDGTNTEYGEPDGSCCLISIAEEEEDDPDAMFCGSYTNLLSVLDTLITICNRGFSEIYTETY